MFTIKMASMYFYLFHCHWNIYIHSHITAETKDIFFILMLTKDLKYVLKEENKGNKNNPDFDT